MGSMRLHPVILLPLLLVAAWLSVAGCCKNNRHVRCRDAQGYPEQHAPADSVLSAPGAAATGARVLRTLLQQPGNVSQSTDEAAVGAPPGSAAADAGSAPVAQPAPVAACPCPQNSANAAQGPSPSDDTDNNLDLRIIAVFAIFAGGFLGCMLPVLVPPFQQVDSASGRLLRCFAGGVILGLAVIHILPEAEESLSEAVKDATRFPVASMVVIAGVLFMIMAEMTVQGVLVAVARRRTEEHHAGLAAGAGSLVARISDGKYTSVPINDGCIRCSLTAHQALPVAKHVGHVEHVDHVELDVGSQSTGELAELRVPNTLCAGEACGSAAVDDAERCRARDAACTHVTSGACDVQHTHACLRGNSAAEWAQVKPHAPFTNGIRQRVIAIIMELGCVFHSFVIGLALGTTTTSRSYVISLTIALTFHQLLEGVALGSIVALARFGQVKYISMLFAYSVTTPAGVAVGIAISSVYNDQSTAALAVQGTLNALSAGMLLYNSILQILGEEFSRDDLYRAGRAPLRWAMVACSTAGALAMAIIGMFA